MIKNKKLVMALLTSAMLVIFSGCSSKADEPKTDDGDANARYSETVESTDYRQLYAKAIDRELGERAKGCKFKMIDVNGDDTLELYYLGANEDVGSGVFFINAKGEAKAAMMKRIGGRYFPGENLYYHSAFQMGNSFDEFYSFVDGEFICTDSGSYDIDPEKSHEEDYETATIIFNGEKVTWEEYSQHKMEKLSGHDCKLEYPRAAVVYEDGKLGPPILLSYDEIMAELIGE